MTSKFGRSKQQYVNFTFKQNTVMVSHVRVSEPLQCGAYQTVIPILFKHSKAVSQPEAIRVTWQKKPTWQQIWNQHGNLIVHIQPHLSCHAWNVNSIYSLHFSGKRYKQHYRYKSLGSHGTFIVPAYSFSLTKFLIYDWIYIGENMVRNLLTILSVKFSQPFGCLLKYFNQTRMTSLQ